MGTGSFTDQNDGEVADAVDVQQLIDAQKGDLVPRNSSGVATANSGNLGTSILPFKRAEISTGYWVAGDIKLFHDFNGTLTPGQGWMKCNGDVVNETNYNAIHGAGSWAEFIGSSPIENKHLPDCDDKFLIGSNDTTENGNSAMSSVGNSAHNVSLAHNHDMEHSHQWYKAISTANTDDKTYQALNIEKDIDPVSPAKSGGEGISLSGGTGSTLESAFTSTAKDFSLPPNDKIATGFALSVTSIKPESHKAQVWIRII